MHRKNVIRWTCIADAVFETNDHSQHTILHFCERALVLSVSRLECTHLHAFHGFTARYVDQQEILNLTRTKILRELCEKGIFRTY
jgi:hypothetical protein